MPVRAVIMAYVLLKNNKSLSDEELLDSLEAIYKSGYQAGYRRQGTQPFRQKRSVLRYPGSTPPK